MSPSDVTTATVEAAGTRIASRIRRTPLDASPSLTALCGVPVALKLETRQITGSFKLRGATNALLSLSPQARAKGVVAASTGNHGRALAHAAAAEGIPAIICMSALVPGNKLAEIRRLGAETRIVGQSQDDAQLEAERLSREGYAMVAPFDDAAVVSGQGTIGHEILDDMADVETVLVPLSGGGLAAGVAAAIKGRKPKTRVIGITMERGAAMAASLAAGHPVLVREERSLADSLGGGIGLKNRITFPLCRDLLDEVILLSEGEIAAGMRHLYAVEREVCEGAGAVGVAALLAGRVGRFAGPVAVIVSGRNVDMTLHRAVMNGVDDPFQEEGA